MLPVLDGLPHPWQEVAYVCTFLLGLVLLERGADWFVDATATLARRLHAPQTLVGLLTAGGEWEELVVVLVAVIGGHAGIALGDIVGSCIANILGSFPLGLFGRRPLVVERSARPYGLALVGVTLLVAGLLVVGPISRPVGGALVGIFALYLASILLALRRGLVRPDMLRTDEDDEDDEEEAREAMARRSLLVQLMFVVVGLGMVAVGALLVVEPAVHFARLFGVSETVIGLTIVAIGTTLPDKALSLAGGLKARGGIVVANAVGSNIFVLTLVLGLSALAAPIVADQQTLRFDVPILAASSLLLSVLIVRERLHWRTGAVLLALYVGYLALQVVIK
ncbi:MAG TPA: hypothetical protein VGP82_18335 [Ktedonobacterales bacterium]|jgi:K+-dependent Na+/Ca+ exchanger-like protein|nr:hypothetical protein [Ktedonobacterales bacterium]